MSGANLHQRFKRLERTRLKGLAAAGASLYATARRRALHAFFVDNDGDWVNWQRHATFVSPTPHRQDARTVEALVHDQWSYRYRPTRGDTVVDVGAGIGEEAVFYSRLVGPSGRVVAVEAHPRTFSCLKKTIARNHLTNVIAVQCAILDGSGEVLISDDVEEHLGNTVLAQHRGGVAVAGKTLDALLEELGVGAVDLLKMNIEGAERAAVLGMTNTMSNTRFVTVSCHDFVADSGGPESMRTRAALRVFLEAEGFDVVRRENDNRPWVRDYLYGANPATNNG